MSERKWAFYDGDAKRPVNKLAEGDGPFVVPDGARWFVIIEHGVLRAFDLLQGQEADRGE